jgi:hypothetical protein
MRLPAGGAVTGWAACRLHGGNFFDGMEPDGRTPIPVPLNVGPHGNLRHGTLARACFHRLDDADRAVVHGVPTVTPARATYDAMRLAADAREALVALEMMAAAEIVSPRALRAYADQVPGAVSARVRWVIQVASEHSRSPNETRLRLIWLLDARLPPPLVNCPVHDRSGRLLGVVDLLDVVAGHAVEFDGAEHRQARRQTADVQKEDRLRGVGLEVTRVTGMELTQAGRLVNARQRALFLPSTERAWVARPPVDDLHQRILERDDAARLHAAFEATPLPDIRELRGY